MNEKRILIKEVIAPCNGCSGAGENVCDNCCDWDMWNSCFTREQAIKQMTDAIFKEIAPCLKPFYKVPKEKRGCVYFAADAALNALLDGHDDGK